MASASATGQLPPVMRRGAYDTTYDTTGIKKTWCTAIATEVKGSVPELKTSVQDRPASI